MVLDLPDDATGALLFIDLNEFKGINDQFGHETGDRVLVGIAQGLKIDNTFVARLGGEEFVVLASHTDAAGAWQLAERIRRNIERIQTVAGRSIGVTISVGTSTLQADEPLKAFFDRADAALYRAKEEGRNRVAVA